MRAHPESRPLAPAIRLLALALLLAGTALQTRAADSDWQTILVPGAWETNGPPAAREYDGYAWYRAWLLPHDSFFTKHERDLFAESVTLSIRGLADAHEIYINGQSIGTGGQFPPQFTSGRTGNHRHKVPPGLLRKGEWNEIAIRVYNESGPGGFLTEPPFIMDYFMECVLQGEWEFRLGDDPHPLGSALKARPPRAAFDQFHESSRVLGEAEQFVHGPKLPPAESLRQLDPHKDFAVDQLLAEPLVAQPTHLSFDERGRLWVAQYRQYPYPAGLKMLSRDKYYRSHYDKVPPPPPNHDRGRDIISIHEDTDRDGQFDRHIVFQDGLNMANAALRGRGGVWVMHTPYLLFYPDADFDDQPDGPPVVHLSGFGLEDTHSVANGLVWGMDGWIYGGQGSTTSSRVIRPNLDPPGSPGVYFEGCMVWRYHPETRAYEIFAEGSGNVFGLEIDAEGRLFSGHNGGDTRGWHYVQGGVYMKQAFDPGKFGPPRNPYAFGGLPMMRATASIPRFSHLFAMGEGTALPDSFQGALFAIDPVHSLVLAARRLTRGATFETTDIGPVLTSREPAFRPVFIVNAPDGSLFIADFYDHYIAHGQHYQSQIDPTTGRIYRLRGKDSPLETDYNLARKSSAELIDLLGHPNKWHRQTAVRLLAERQDPSTVTPLVNLLTRPGPHGPLEALWTLFQLEKLDEPLLLEALQHPHAAVRMWAVRFAGEIWGQNPGLGSPPPDLSASDRGLPPRLNAAILRQAANEPDPEVRSQIASSARRLPPAQSLPLARALLLRDEDLSDPYLPLLCWWIVESAVEHDPEAVLGLFKDQALWNAPVVVEHILPRLMRRFATEGRRQDLLACAELLRQSPSSAQTAQLLKGFEEAYRGRLLSGLPDELVSALAEAGKISLILRLRQGSAEAVGEALALLRNAKAPLAERILYARTLGEVRATAALPVLLDLAERDPDSELRKAALSALAPFDEPAVGSQAAALLPQLPASVRPAAWTLLLSRPAWTASLLKALQSGAIPLSSVPAEIADRLRTYPDSPIRAAAVKLLPPPEPDSESDLPRQIAAIESALASGPGNPYAGEQLFQERCASCHKLFFKGANVGPDLTSYQRDNLGTMLISIVNPNAEIREGYQAYEIETKDGRSLSGFITERDETIVVLRTLDGQDQTLRQTDLTKIEPSGRSLMPEGLLDGLTDQQLRDFFAFLRSSQPFTR